MLLTWLSGKVAACVLQVLVAVLYLNGCVKSLPAKSDERPPMA